LVAAINKDMIQRILRWRGPALWAPPRISLSDRAVLSAAVAGISNHGVSVQQVKHHRDNEREESTQLPTLRMQCRPSLPWSSVIARANVWRPLLNRPVRGQLQQA